MAKQLHSRYIWDWFNGLCWHCVLCDSVWLNRYRPNGMLEDAHCPNCCGERVWCRKAEYVRSLDVATLAPSPDIMEQLKPWLNKPKPVFILGQVAQIP